MELSTSTVKQWIDGNAYPLPRLDPAAPLTDLEPLASMIGDAAVVGLGESTRASRELFALRLRIFRLLVEQLGFRALAMQDNQVLCARLDEYVRTGAGDPRRLLAEAWAPWRTEETVEALEWMRSFNVRHRGDPIRVFGVDPATAQLSHYDTVADYVGRVAPDRLGELESHYGPIRTAHEVGEHVQRFQGTHPGRPFVEHARDAFTLVASLPEGDGRDEALQYARTITDFHDSSIAANIDLNVHARFAADAITRWHRDTGSKIAYWDGIAFVAAGGPFDIKITSSQLLFGPGGRLRRHFGQRYVSVLLGFHHGRIHNGIEVPVSPADYLEATLGDADLTAYYLDLRAPAPPEVTEWLAGAHKTRVVPGVYDPAEDAEHHVVADPLSEWFDVLVHIREITPTRLLA